MGTEIVVEIVVGFTVATDFGSKHTVHHNTVELELMIYPAFSTTKALDEPCLDRILAALSPDHGLSCVLLSYSERYRLLRGRW